MSRRSLHVAAFVLSAALALAAPSRLASAQSGASPLPALGEGRADEGERRVEVSFRVTRFATEYEEDKRVESLDNPEVTALAGALTVRHGLRCGLVMDLALPAAALRLDPEAEDVPVTRTNGLGDVEAGASWDAAALWGARDGDPRLFVRVGLALPTGEPGSLWELDEGIDPATTAIGFGAFTAALALEGVVPLGERVAIRLPIGVRRALHRSAGDVSYGQLTAAALGVEATPWPWLDGGLRLAWRRSGQAHRSGVGMLPESGSHVLEGEAAIGFSPARHLRFGVFGRFPVFVVVEGRQIAESFSWGASFRVTDGGDRGP